jgi:hypothetical protein
MNAAVQKHRAVLALVSFVAAGLLSACASMGMGHRTEVSLTGAQEVPPVSTSARGSGTLTIAPDRSVAGSITTTGVAGAAAHIHEAPPGRNGPVIIPLTKSGDNVWAVPAGAKLTENQYESYKGGNLYVNVHSAAHKDGEIRGQLKP